MLDAVYAQDDNMVFRRIGEEVILVPIRRQTVNLEAVYTLNETGAAIWEMLDGQRTLVEIRDALVAEFDVSPEKAEADVLEYVEMLESIEAVRHLP